MMILSVKNSGGKRKVFISEKKGNEVRENKKTDEQKRT